jgi:hypothetical protein
MTPAHNAIIAALAKRAVADHLTPQTPTQQADQAKRPNHVPLPDQQRAA